MKLIALLTLCCTGILILDFVMVTRLQAHGDMKQIYVGTTANFEISVKSIPHKPMVGQAHFSIEPKNASTGEPITQALITLIVRLEDEAFQSRAVNSTDYPHMYDANLTFHRPGIWGIQISMSSVNHGDSTTSFNMEISGVASVPKTSAGLFFLFVFSVIITGTVILYLRYRRPRVGTT